MWHDLAQRAAERADGIAVVAILAAGWVAAWLWRRHQDAHRHRDYSGDRPQMVHDTTDRSVTPRPPFRRQRRNYSGDRGDLLDVIEPRPWWRRRNYDDRPEVVHDPRETA